MSIESHELVEILQGTLSGALPREQRHLRTVIDTIEQTNLTATLDSAPSIFLQEVIENCREFISDEDFGWITGPELYGVDINACDAVARCEAGRQQIIVFSGLVQMIRMYGELLSVLTLLARGRKGPAIYVQGKRETELSAYVVAAISVILNYVETGTATVNFGDILGPEVKMRTDVAWKCGVYFIIAHEAAHLQLGHFDAATRHLSERMVSGLPISEASTIYRTRELAADATAIESLRPEARHWFFPGLSNFLGPFSLLEAFGRDVGETHPLCANRTAQLAKLAAPPDPKHQRMFTEIIEFRTRWFQGMAESRSTSKTGDVRDRILRSLPIWEATQIIRGIHENVIADSQYLDDKN